MKPRIQSLLVLVCAALSLVTAGCPKEEAAPAATGVEPAATAIDTAVIEDLYNRNCSLCHGQALEGRGGMAPAITGMNAHWKSVAELAKYLHDPQGYADKDERLGANRDKYSMRMPAIPTMTDAERLAMAEWILTK